jgi:flagellar motor switch protein FliN
MDATPTRSEGLNLSSFLSTWTESLSQVLGQIAQAEFHGSTGPARPLEGDVVRVTFSLHGNLEGEQGFALTVKDAVWIAQTLMAEPPDGSTELTADYRDALGESFRQFAGTVATTLKLQAGGEVEIRFERIGNWTWKAGYDFSMTLQSGLRPELLLRGTIDEKLVKALERTLPAVKANSQKVAAMPPSLPPASGGNLDLLLEVTLEVSLRFGQREMLLAEVLELSAGAVVELDQKIQEPVELLVSGKVVARGEVVVMEGHYAFRVLEIVSPAERMASLHV